MNSKEDVKKILRKATSYVSGNPEEKITPDFDILKAMMEKSMSPDFENSKSTERKNVFTGLVVENFSPYEESLEIKIRNFFNPTFTRDTTFANLVKIIWTEVGGDEIDLEEARNLPNM